MVKQSLLATAAMATPGQWAEQVTTSQLIEGHPDTIQWTCYYGVSKTPVQERRVL